MKSEGNRCETVVQKPLAGITPRCVRFDLDAQLSDFCVHLSFVFHEPLVEALQLSIGGLDMTSMQVQEPDVARNAQQHEQDRHSDVNSCWNARREWCCGASHGLIPHMLDAAPCL